MFEKALLQNFLEKSLSHKGKLNVILETFQSFVKNNILTVAELGRKIENGNTTKSNIYKMSRLFNGGGFHRERKNLYQALNLELLKNNKQPIISVDWTDSHSGSPTQILSACIGMSGRAIVCYDQVFPNKWYNSKKAHRRFVEGLAQILPKDCKPIIVTDSASSFGVEWFELIKEQGWYWLGRAKKNFGLCCIKGEFLTVAELYTQASSDPQQFKNALLTKAHQLLCDITIIKKYSDKKKLPRKNMQTNAAIAMLPRNIKRMVKNHG